MLNIRNVSLNRSIEMEPRNMGFDGLCFSSVLWSGAMVGSASSTGSSGEQAHSLNLAQGRTFENDVSVVARFWWVD